MVGYVILPITQEGKTSRFYNLFSPEMNLLAFDRLTSLATNTFDT